MPDEADMPEEADMPAHDLPSAVEHLRAQREAAPEWLAQLPTDPMPDPNWLVSAFLSSRIVFYPGSGTDGDPVRVFGSTHSAHCFLYVDYTMTRQQIETELLERPFLGYRGARRISIGRDDLGPAQWNPHLTREEMEDAIRSPRYQFVRPHLVDGFAFMEILQRMPGFGDDHGPERLAVLFIGGEGITTYDALFCQDGQAAPFAAVLHDHGFGLAFTTFGRGGLLELIATRTGRFPRYLHFRCERIWPGYQQAAQVERDTDRQLYVRGG